MKQGTYTLPDSELRAISELRALSPDRPFKTHNFRNTNYDEYMDDGLDITLLKPQWRDRFRADTPDYIVWFNGDYAIPLAWYNFRTESWVIPETTIPTHASLNRIKTFILGVQFGMDFARQELEGSY